jgi:hypothetical protein
LLSEDDSLTSSMRAGAMMAPPRLLEGIDSEDSLIIDDDNFMLDITQDLPIRKP